MDGVLLPAHALDVHRTGHARPAYEDIASKFFEHFVKITDAINTLGGDGLWDEEDGFYYDQPIIDHHDPIPMKVRSLVGLLPVIAVTVFEQEPFRFNHGGEHHEVSYVPGDSTPKRVRAWVPVTRPAGPRLSSVWSANAPRN